MRHFQRNFLAATAALLVSPLSLAQDNAPPAGEDAPGGGKFIVAPLLVAAVTSGISGSFTSGIQQVMGGLFNKVYNKIFGEPCQPNGMPMGGYQQPYAGQYQPQYGMQYPAAGSQGCANNGSATHTISANMIASPISPADAAAGGVEKVPASIAVAMEQLDPTTYKKIKTFERIKESPPTLKTGDVFALLYETNMPGQVRLENVDTSGATSPLGTYNMVARQQRRLPSTKGFEVSGPSGTETLNIYFTPCRPPEAEGRPGVVEYAYLPSCSNTQAVALAKAGKSGGLRPKLLINQDSPDPDIAVGVAGDYSIKDAKAGMPLQEAIHISNQATGI